MKQYLKYIAFLIAAATVFTGCKRGFLDVPAQGKLTVDQALIDPAAADKLVAGAYNTLYLQGTVGLKLVIIGDVTSDDADKGSVASDPGFDGIFLDGFTQTPNTGIFNDVWREYYSSIGRINSALSVLESGTYDETVKKQLIGEVRFLRGYYYFNLVRIFGGVPKLTRVVTPAEQNNDEFQTRASKEEIYAQIIEDLSYGVENLPEKGAAGAIVGRATKGAAQALLSKVYLYQQNWQGAYDLSLAVINSGKYDLATDYAKIFREKAASVSEGGVNNIESIFEVQTGPNRATDGSCNAISKNYSNFQAPRGTFPNQIVAGQSWTGGDLGFGLNTPSANLAAAYEANDKRRAATIIFTGSTPTVLWDGFTIPAQPAVVGDRYNYKAYHSPFLESLSCNGLLTDKDNRPKNIRLMRYAEVLLINAEAAAHTGKDAMTPLAKVRTRAGLTTSSATIADIWKERRVELAMEADRFFDLVRTGQAATVMQALGKPFIAGKHELFPIPQVQIDFSGGRLKQNPNY
ncbi:RagB/SusD family nutrient uptake outer membrane protein [Niabella beijingensis]|uniref:RagB/SusD family nutrient uptake outer membrane protein n=1 Tax=Niabella beijingensis TaxID=2872700 RepID=UPI001CC07A3B|nr:RagB/SusD family nutrient uptake outer membrane protein [Niabella beijingensis]MBZ4189141.1 RagB/SusD family nutrient uptake outer membrane protein [Niabella beijingensis]